MLLQYEPDATIGSKQEMRDGTDIPASASIPSAYGRRAKTTILVSLEAAHDTILYVVELLKEKIIRSITPVHARDIVSVTASGAGDRTPTAIVDRSLSDA